MTIVTSVPRVCSVGIHASLPQQRELLNFPSQYLKGIFSCTHTYIKNNFIFKIIPREYFNIRSLIRDEWILLSDKFIFSSLVHLEKLTFGKISIFIYNSKLIFMWAS